MERLERAGGESLEDVFLQDNLGSTIAEHATQCQSLFQKYMGMPKFVPDPTIMDDQLARFSLWASNMEVYGPLNVSLDYRLRFSPTATDIIHQLLDIICDALLSLKPIDDRPPQISSRKRQRISAHSNSGVTRRADDDDASDSESDVDPAEGNISKINETIGGTVTRLFRLSNAVRKSAKANRARKIERYRDDEEANRAIDELRLYTKCYIEFRFPEAPQAPRSALVEANALRLRRLCYQRSHRRRIDMSIQSPTTAPAVVSYPNMTGHAPAVRFAPVALPKPATTNRMPAPLPVPATNATTARQTDIAALYAKSTTEAPRAHSVLVNSKLSFPPIPPGQQCPYCGVILEFKNTARSSLWQNHVINDLEPFICVFSHCLEGGHDGQGTSPLTFETSKAWLGHMQTAHGHVWECRAPSHDPIIFDQEIQYQEHSIQEHSVPEAHAKTLSNAARRPVLDKVLECPFSDDFQPPDKVESSAVFSSEALQSHVAGHMKEIALLTLQKLPSDDDENAPNVDSDQISEASGIPRSSMDSVLDDEDLAFQDGDTEAVNSKVGHREENIIARPTVRDLVDLEEKDDFGMTTLHHVVQASNLGMVKSLILSGAIVNCRDEHGQTPLHYAAEMGFIECIDVLIEHGADLHITDTSGFSPFLWARLLHYGADANSSSADGKFALHWAANLGYYSTARMLVEHHRTRPLAEAAASGNLRTDPNHRDRDAGEGYTEIVRLLLDAGANPHAVSLYGYSSTVALLLRRGADSFKSTSHGWTALHHAAFMGHFYAVKCLLEDDRIRSTASQQDDHGCRDLATPLTLFDESGLTAEDWLGRWPKGHSQEYTGNVAFLNLRQAVVIGNVPMIKLLVKLGHNINGMNSGRRTALYHAAEKGMLPIVDLLLDLGRKSWEEFISRGGYYRRDTDPELERQIRQVLKVHNQRSVPDQPASTLPMPDQPVPRRPKGRPHLSQRFNDPDLRQRYITTRTKRNRWERPRLFMNRLTKRDERLKRWLSSGAFPCRPTPHRLGLETGAVFEQHRHDVPVLPDDRDMDCCQQASILEIWPPTMVKQQFQHFSVPQLTAQGCGVGP
ncbi:ankyrin [Emericellopsis atlantica]|uniref:Ankyrin n=1 Tax=Emericellopsis atlantica TaxID=2614577 RepID=A0A9P8CNG8_9HYPO|nr:ankyrin [Emericellopsis atlantica]KAG9253122.1 ankyrin [Emericellopsis atlantica]